MGRQLGASLVLYLMGMHHCLQHCLVHAQSANFYASGFASAWTESSAEAASSDAAQPSDHAHDTEQTEATGANTKTEIRAISILISHSSLGAAAKQLQAAIALTELRSLPLKSVYIMRSTVCTALSRASGLLSAMHAAGGRLLCISKLPESLRQIQSTPTWILDSVKGQVLLEGYQDAGTFISANRMLRNVPSSQQGPSPPEPELLSLWEDTELSTAKRIETRSKNAP